MFGKPLGLLETLSLVLTHKTCNSPFTLKELCSCGKPQRNASSTLPLMGGTALLWSIHRELPSLDKCKQLYTQPQLCFVPSAWHWLALYRWRKKHLVSAVCACAKFSQNLGNHVILVFFYVWVTHNCFLVLFCIMATCSDSDDEFSSALVLRIIYTSKEYSDWKPWRNDCVMIVLLFAPWCCAVMY